MISRAPASANTQDPLLLALLVLSAAGVGVFLFWGRIDEVSVLGLTIKLAPQLMAAAADIQNRTSDDQLADETATKFLSALFARAAKQQDLKPKDVEEVKDEALQTAVDDLAAGLTVASTPEGLRVTIEHSSARGIRVTTAPLLIPAEQFGADLASRINSADAYLGRRLAAIDSSSLQVLAALRYGIDPQNRILIDALATIDDQALGFAARACAATLTEYLHVLVRKQGWDDTVLLWLDEEPPEEQLEVIGALNFRPATEAETVGLPPGVFFRQQP